MKVNQQIFLCVIGTEIKAAMDGVVVKTVNNINKKWTKMYMPPTEVMTPNEQYGNFVIIAHSNEEFSWYCHMAEYGIKVQEGQKIKKGDILGVIGDTGWTIKTHLHFMVTKFIDTQNKSYYTLDINWENYK